MPLMMCPNCQTEMKEINRQNVVIDMCAQCHGVWLDRGELNKLLEINRQEQAEAPPPPRAAQPYPSQPRYRDHDDDDDDDRYYARHGHHRRRKSKFESLFDIFD